VAPPLVVGTDGNIFLGSTGSRTPPAGDCGEPPAAPERARALQLSGTVLVEFEVSATGELRQVWRLSDAPPLLYRTVRQWLRACRFKPAIERGRPVAGRRVQFVRYRASHRAGPSRRDPQLPVETLLLKSGLRVLLSPSHETPLVTVALRYDHGLVSDPTGRYGLSHFAGSALEAAGRAAPLLPPLLLSSPDMPGGSCAVDLDAVWCWQTVSPKQTRAALLVERERLVGAATLVDEQWLAKTRSQVASMLRQGRAPYWLTFRETYRQLFAEGHPLRAGFGGSEEETARATVAEVRTLLRERFTPANALLVVAGEFDPEVVRRLCEELLEVGGGSPAAPRPALPAVSLPSSVEQVVVDPSAPGPRLDLVWRGIAQTDSAADDATADVLLELLAEGRRSRLRLALGGQAKLAGSYSSTDGQSGWLRVTITPAAGHSPRELLPRVQAEIDRLRASGPTQAEVTSAIASRLQELFNRAETTEGMGNRAMLLASLQFGAGGPRTFAEALANLRAVTPAMVEALALSRLSSSERAVLITQTSGPAPQ
jgi:zinc protease